MPSEVNKDIQWVDPKTLKESPNNRNQHSSEQIDRIIKLINFYGWRHPIIIRKETGLVIVGHGRLRASIKAGWAKVPIQIQSFENDDEAYGFMVADNAVASWAELDLAGINLDVPDLGINDIDLLGIKNFVIDMSEKESSQMEAERCETCGNRKKKK